MVVKFCNLRNFATYEISQPVLFMVPVLVFGALCTILSFMIYTIIIIIIIIIIYIYILKKIVSHKIFFLKKFVFFYLFTKNQKIFAV